MKLKILFTLFTFSVLASVAQTNSFPTTGNVGIGTLNPGVKLQVQKDGTSPAITIGGANSGSPRLQVYGLSDDPNAWMGLGADMAGGPYEHSVYFPAGTNNYMGKLSIGDYNGANYNARLMVLANGNVGVGTSSPTSKLQIVGEHVDTKLTLFYPNPEETKQANLALWASEPGVSWSGVGIGNNVHYLTTGGVARQSSTRGGSYIRLLDKEMRFQIMNNNGVDISALAINPIGDVGIGTIAPKEKLSVNGKIRAHEIKVETQNWPDYVFEEGYDIGTLQELENYININKHLPEIPTASDVANDGIELGEMNKLLLKKIEELTLHVIEKDKKITGLERRLDDIEKKIKH